MIRRSLSLIGALLGALAGASAAPRPERPNILIAIADDQSWSHTSASGAKALSTPGFDRVAREGVLFTRCIAGSPGCSPSRAALLTGRHHWMVEHAGTHASSFSPKYAVFPDLLEKAGYAVGFTGKGWGPGDWKVEGRSRNPAGPDFSKRRLKAPLKGISAVDYAGNFDDFLAQRPKDAPFCFWYGGQEPHRDYEKGSGLAAGKRLEDVEVPPFLPDTPEIRSDLLDYSLEIEWFDLHLQRMLAALEKAGELDRTLVIVTADNGMPFPRAKANLYEHGIRVPLSLRWPKRVPGGRTVDDVVGFVDLTATVLDAARVEHPGGGFPPVGRSLMNILESEQQGLVDPARTAAYSGRERHSSSRPDNLGYPCRALRTPDFLYIRNFHPEYWPAGDPRTVDGAAHGGYHDIDACPTQSFLVQHRTEPAIRPYFLAAVAKRPAVELFDLRSDTACMRNVAEDPAHAETRARLGARLDRTLQETGDPRLGTEPDIFESYRRYSPIRKFPPSPESVPD